MTTWFSEYRVRTMAERLAPQIAPRVEAAILATIRSELPILLMEELRRELPGHTPKGSAAERKMRDDAIRSMWSGNNAKDLSVMFGLSTKQIIRIATGRE